MTGRKLDGGIAFSGFGGGGYGAGGSNGGNGDPGGGGGGGGDFNPSPADGECDFTCMLQKLEECIKAGLCKSETNSLTPPPGIPTIVNPGSPIPLPLPNEIPIGRLPPLPVPNLPPPQVPDFRDGAPVIGALRDVARGLGGFLAYPSELLSCAVLSHLCTSPKTAIEAKQLSNALLVADVATLERTISRLPRVGKLMSAAVAVRRALLLGRGSRDELAERLGKSLGERVTYSYRPNPKGAADIVEFNQKDIQACLKDPNCLVIQIRNGIPGSARPGQPGYFSVKETEFLEQLKKDGVPGASDRVIKVFDQG